jgi:hypothetical protein
MLNNEELEHLEMELKQFLIVNGVHSEEWLQINKTEPEKAVRLVELFSDSVLETVYDKIKVLEFRSPESCMVFYFHKYKVELISIQRNKDSKADLSSPESIHSSLINYSDELSFFKSEKAIQLTRNLEIHRMIEQGCYVSTIEFWESLNLAIA